MLRALTPADGNAILPLADARAHLNLTSDDSYHDTAVSALRDAAIDFVEGYSGKALSRRQFEWSADRFSSAITLPVGPIVSDAATVSYYSSDGTDTVLTSGFHFGRGQIVAASGTTWPSTNGYPGGVRVTFTAGYATAEEIPPMLLAGVKLAMSAMFEDRSTPDLSGAMRCIDRHRMPGL